MSISIFEPPPTPQDDEARERAVLMSGALDASGDAILGSICSELCHILGAAASLISILYGETQYVIGAKGIAPGAYRRRHSFSGHVLAAADDVFFVPNLADDERFSENPWVNGEAAKFRFYIASRIRVDGYHPIGVISAVGAVPRPAMSQLDRDVILEAGHLVAERLRVLRAESSPTSNF